MFGWLSVKGMETLYCVHLLTRESVARFADGGKSKVGHFDVEMIIKEYVLRLYAYTNSIIIQTFTVKVCSTYF